MIRDTGVEWVWHVGQEGVRSGIRHDRVLPLPLYIICSVILDIDQINSLHSVVHRRAWPP